MGVPVSAAAQAERLEGGKAAPTERPALTAALLVGVAAACVALAVTAPPNHDVAWLSIATGRLLDGGTPGGDIWEPNPPLILWIMAPAVAAARLAGIDHHLAYAIWISGIAAASAFVGARTARPVFPDAARARIFACALLGCLLVLPGHSFGQREHVLLILIAPYLLWETCAPDRGDPASRGPGVGISVAAAAGLLLKPPLAVLVAGFVGLRMARARSVRPLLRPGYLAMLACAAAYGLAIVAFHPEWVAMTRLTSIVYAAYNPPAGQLVYVFAPFALLIALALVFLAPHGSWSARIESPAGAMLFASALLLLGALAQLKGWTYHRLPSGVAFVLAGLIFILSAAAPRVGGLAAKVALGLAAFLLARPFGSSAWFERARGPDPEVAELVRRADGRPVMAFSTVLQAVFPALTEAGGIWGSRFPCQWLVPGVVELATGDADDRRAAARIRYAAAGLVAADLRRYRPAVVALRTGNDPFMPAGFDWLGFYGVHPAFREAWRDYCPSAPTTHWKVYARCADAASTT